MGNLSQREYLTIRLPEEWKAETLLKEDLIKIAKKRMMLTQKGDSAENEGTTSGASGLALTECPTQEPFSEILILAVEPAMENLSLLNLLQGSSQNVPSQEPQTVPSPTIILVKELDEEQALQEVCPLQPEQFSGC
uniref:Uncharacterized protein n=1 Tax=Pipistrellus kuhlii TaxID=59472 RepID=A0A7J7ZJH0_PIPKU|nr:hypothetical protein mPipKuh1_009482 [Pipistrellus kuhlii]